MDRQNHATALPLPRVNLIAALGRNRAIGRDNALLWKLPADLAHFKKVTLGHPIVMGRKTWESLGRALPGRRNIVVSRDQDYVASGAEVCGSLHAALLLCADAPEVWVIGGAQIYAQALPLAHRMWLTEVHDEPEADAFFPDWEAADFTEASREHHPATLQAPGFDLVLLQRRISLG